MQKIAKKDIAKLVAIMSAILLLAVCAIVAVVIRVGNTGNEGIQGGFETPVVRVAEPDKTIGIDDKTTLSITIVNPISGYTYQIETVTITNDAWVDESGNPQEWTKEEIDGFAPIDWTFKDGVKTFNFVGISTGNDYDKANDTVKVGVGTINITFTVSISKDNIKGPESDKTNLSLTVENRLGGVNKPDLGVEWS